MQGRRGFTLVELLVVIAIIALLLSILMPSLRKAREQARNVVDRSNLKQWACILLMYANDYEGGFPPGWSVPKGMWMSRMRSYYQDREICLCPKAAKLQSDGYPPGPFVGWGIYGDPAYYDGWIPPWGDEGDYGSYSMNGWMCNPPDEGGLYVIPEAERPWFWRSINVGGKDGSPSNIPMFCDGVWDGTMARHNDPPPPYPGAAVGLEGMWNYCIPRHGDFIHVCFLDSSVRMVSLKCLWSLKWHRKFRTDVQPPEWPDWMKNIKGECD
jgi:prepilin-type N-terminal cleavage/methylation domain-containing protein